jgi:prepilin peptidase CpaA
VTVATAVTAYLFPAALAVAALFDIRRYEIPNAIPAALIAAFGVHAVLGGAEAAAVLWSLSGGVGVLVAGAIAFRFGLLGGGDAKLLAAASPWVGLPGIPGFLLVTALAGGILGVLVLILRRVSVRVPLQAWLARRVGPDVGLPYAVAIFFGGMSMFPAVRGGALPVESVLPAAPGAIKVFGKIMLLHTVV